MKTELDETKKRARESGSDSEVDPETDSQSDTQSKSELPSGLELEKKPKTDSEMLTQQIAEQEKKAFTATKELISALEDAAADIGRMRASFSPFFRAYSSRLRPPQQKYHPGFQTDARLQRKR